MGAAIANIPGHRVLRWIDDLFFFQFADSESYPQQTVESRFGEYCGIDNDLPPAGCDRLVDWRGVLAVVSCQLSDESAP
jgi:hypothetical protein